MLDFSETRRTLREGASEAEAIVAAVDSEVASESTRLTMKALLLSRRKMVTKTTSLQEDREALSEVLLEVASEVEKEDLEAVMLLRVKAAEDAEEVPVVARDPGLLKSTETEVKSGLLSTNSLLSHMRPLLRLRRSNDALSINWRLPICRSRSDRVHRPW